MRLLLSAVLGMAWIISVERRTQCEVRRDSFDKRNTESSWNVTLSTCCVPYGSVQTSSRILCDGRRFSVSAVQVWFFSESGQSQFKANASADSASSTTPLTRTTQLKRGKPQTGTTDDAKVTQVELWRLEKCDLRVKAWEAREIQLEVRVGAKHECLSEWAVRMKLDLKLEPKEEVLRDCFHSTTQTLEYLL